MAGRDWRTLMRRQFVIGELSQRQYRLTLIGALTAIFAAAALAVTRDEALERALFGALAVFNIAGLVVLTRLRKG